MASHPSFPGVFDLLKAYWLPLTAVLVIVYHLSNKYQRNLVSIPGPQLAAYSRLWRLYQVWTGHFHMKQIELHRKYGRVVRIAPNVVSIGDPAAIPTIYGLKHDYLKTAFYPIQCISWKKEPQMNLFSTRDPAESRQERRKMANPYSLSSLLQSEAGVDACSELFMSRMAEYAKDGRSVDLGTWLQYYAFDVVGELTFAQQLGFLEQGKDVDGTMKAIEGMLAYAALCGQVPEAHNVLLGNPLFTKLLPAMETWNQVLVFTLKAMKSRTKLGRNEELANVEDAGGVDMLSKLNAVKTTDPLKMSTRDIIVHLSGNVFAGSDTTSIALRSVVYNLCRNPEKLQKMLAELDAADREKKLSRPISYKESVTNLPYFAAVLKEAMRLHPSVGLIMERHVPTGGVELCGHYIPGGTIIGINPWVLNYEEKTFPRPESFEPERWLEVDDPRVKERENIINFNFGAGARSCLGKNISMMEMHKILPELFRRYTVELQGDWKVTNHWFVQQDGMVCKLMIR